MLGQKLSISRRVSYDVTSQRGASGTASARAKLASAVIDHNPGQLNFQDPELCDHAIDKMIETMWYVECAPRARHYIYNSATIALKI